MGELGISIDLDSLYCYQRIYGLPTDEADNRIYETGLSRFIDLMDEFGFKGTLFAVGRDLNMGDNAATLRRLSESGHEIANHSLNHDYRLSRMDRAEMTREVSEAKERLQDAVGREVAGFRAPGYNVNETLLDVIAGSGHLYDSSVFPCWPYYGAKAGALAWLRLRGRKSRSILGGPGVLAAPIRPYRPKANRYWRPGETSLVELPISVDPIFRFPFLGHFIILMGESWFSRLFRLLRLGSGSLVLEFHGMDFMDGVADGLPKELLKQPDVAVSWERKEALFRHVFRRIRETREVRPLREMAQDLTGRERAENR